MEGLKTNSHPPLEGSEGKKKSQDGEKRACVWWRRRGRGKGCKAVSPAAAAGGSPREEEVRAGPGGSSASQGRRRRTLHSHRELRAVAAGRHTLARRARLSVGAAGCARLRRRPGPSRCAPLRSKLLWGPLGNCRRTAGKLQEDGSVWMGGLRACGPESLETLFLRLLCALSGQSLEISEES